MIRFSPDVFFRMAILLDTLESENLADPLSVTQGPDYGLRRNKELYSHPATTPPASGPTQYTP
jgi:hypothetical protein